ncbi:MAG: hypothetical protein HYZ27_06630 [Deltaproteobacteria bacterium]|nr:hypothetical protein [Deltaproteobacteria bacterium]
MQDSPADLASWHGRATLFGVEKRMAALGRRIARLEEAEIRAAARRVFRRRGLVACGVGEIARGEWGRVQAVVERWRGDE